MKVVCINNGIIVIKISGKNHNIDALNLTNGKSYDATEGIDVYVCIKDDGGYTMGYMKERFILLEEHRENKLIELGI